MSSFRPLRLTELRCLAALLVLLLWAARPVASQTCQTRGSERWPIKTSLSSVSSAGHSGKTVSLADLPDPPDADELDHDAFDAVRPPSFLNALNVKEGAVVDVEGWIHLIAREPDGDYHIQMTGSPGNGNGNLIVEVPCGLPDFVKSESLRRRFEDVRALIRDKMLKGKEPGLKGNLMGSPPYVHLRGQLFYDASHFGDAPRGKLGMKAATIWEIHPVVAMWFVAPPDRERRGARMDDKQVSHGRNLVLCCDGTKNEFGKTNTNVVRLFQSLVQDPARQIAYYDPGVGTMPEPTYRTKIAQKFSTVGGLGFGWGLATNVEEAYTFLMNHWRLGDRVFLFGFSRGAYSVRVLASFLRQVGLLVSGQEPLLPYAFRIFKAIRGQREHDAADSNASTSRRVSYWRLCRQFQDTFAQPVGRPTRCFPVHFLGVWDTVSAYGRVWNPRGFPYTRSNPSVDTVRHAVSLDERRWFYQQNVFAPVTLDAPLGGGPASNQNLKERWFPGVHSDIGGGYSEADGGLWRVAFEWMLAEAVTAGLLIDPGRIAHVRRRSPEPESPWAEPRHESLKGPWWAAQFFPKMTYDPATGRRWPRIGWWGCRNAEGAVLHSSVLRRIREDQSYRPRSLPAASIHEILGLARVDDATTVTVPAGGCR